MGGKSLRKLNHPFFIIYYLFQNDISIKVYYANH